jgi:hypothetical protein
MTSAERIPDSRASRIKRIALGADGVNLSVGDMTRGRIEQPLYRLPGRRDLLKAYAD